MMAVGLDFQSILGHSVPDMNYIHQTRVIQSTR